MTKELEERRSILIGVMIAITIICFCLPSPANVDKDKKAEAVVFPTEEIVRIPIGFEVVKDQEPNLHQQISDLSESGEGNEVGDEICVAIRLKRTSK